MDIALEPPKCITCKGLKVIASIGKKAHGRKAFRIVHWDTCPRCRGSGRKTSFAWDICRQRPIYS